MRWLHDPTDRYGLATFRKSTLAAAAALLVIALMRASTRPEALPALLVAAAALALIVVFAGPIVRAFDRPPRTGRNGVKDARTHTDKGGKRP